ncbi:MAG: uroporphyrinogen-III synthase [Chloroflexi bacterium]|nr:uroporphyrinogen-III synthase [Chloroflexota bacterium]MBV9603270.1 uroporphyrinogen-III synthase [Chloroflexota bacterium]
MSRTIVLNTRPSEQSSELSGLLRSAGFEVVEAPAIAIVPAWDAHNLEEVRLDLARGAFDWVVLPSQNAARGLELELRDAGDRVVCGDSTATALGLVNARAIDRYSAAAAVAVLQPLARAGQRVLVPRAAEGREELVDGLRDLGLEVAAPVAYRTVPADAARARLLQGDVEVVTLCSPSAASSVASAVSPRMLVLALGQTTAAAARAAGLRVDGVAVRPTMTALVAAIQSALAVRA